MKRLLLAFALASGLSLPVAAFSADAPTKFEKADPAQDKAVRGIAMEFLGEIDGNRVGNTWAYVSDYLRGTLTRAEWEKGIVDARAGSKPGSRELMGALFTRELEGRKGQFFIVVYKSRYGSQWIQERVVLALQGKEWKVDGYWMLPADENGIELKKG